MIQVHYACQALQGTRVIHSVNLGTKPKSCSPRNIRSTKNRLTDFLLPHLKQGQH